MNRPGAASRAELSPLSRPLLFALADGALPAASLRRALLLAEALEVKVHVLRVVFGRWPLLDASPQVDLLTITRAAEHVFQSERSLEEWLTTFLPTAWLVEEPCTRSGDFVAQVAARAREIGAGLIVVPSGEARVGDVAAKLACTVQLPVLVARDGLFRRGIVAATDLGEPAYPVLRMAASLGRRLDVPVMALHNLSPLVLSPPGGCACPVALETACSSAREHLERALTGMGSQHTAVVADEVDAVDAILHAAQAQNVDLITVGTRPRSWFERLIGSSIAARVIDGTQRSVLVVPIARARPIELRAPSKESDCSAGAPAAVRASE